MEFSSHKVEGIVELDCPNFVLLNWYFFWKDVVWSLEFVLLGWYWFVRMLFGHCSCLMLSY